MLVGIDSPDKVKQTGKATNFAWFAIHPFVRKVLNVNWLTEVLPSFIRSKPVADRRHPKMISQLNFYAARRDYRFIINRWPSLACIKRKVNCFSSSAKPRRA